MSSWQKIASILAVSAVAALLGASCAVPDEPVVAGDDIDAGNRTHDGRTSGGRRGPGVGGGCGCGGVPVSPECCGVENGLYCGGNMITGDPDTLYRCSCGEKQVVKHCGSGVAGTDGGSCVREPPGTPDHCR